MKRLACLLFLLLPVTSLAGEDGRPMKVEDLFRFKRVADPQISQDGKLVVYTVGDADLAGNKVTSHLWLVATDKGSTPKQLTTAPKSDRHPRWSPDGKSILFESSRSGTSQLWIIDRDGGEPRQLTTISTGASLGAWSRDGKRIAFMSTVWPEYSTKPFKESDAARAEIMAMYRENIGRDVPAFRLARQAARDFKIDDREATAVLKQGIWRRELRVDLFQPVLMDKVLRPEVTDVLVRYADWFKR